MGLKRTNEQASKKIGTTSSFYFLGGDSFKMTVVTKHLTVNTKEENDVIDVTDRVERLIEESGLGSGVATLFVAGSTAAITTIEYEPGLCADFPAMLQRVAPSSVEYEHEKRWHDGNGRSHVKASLVGPSLSVPFVNRKLTLGTWQQIVLVELDTRARKREIVVQIMGEALTP